MYLRYIQLLTPSPWIVFQALPKVMRSPSAEKSCHPADSVQNKMDIRLLWRNRMSNDEKFRNFRAYHFESEQSEHHASRRKWALILILASSSVGLAYLLSS